MRAKSKAQAYRQLTDDIAANLSVLCVPAPMTGHVVLNLKDAMAMLRENEEFLKGNEDAQKSPLEAVQEFLNA